MQRRRTQWFVLRCNGNRELIHSWRFRFHSSYRTGVGSAVMGCLFVARMLPITAIWADSHIQ